MVFGGHGDGAEPEAGEGGVAVENGAALGVDVEDVEGAGAFGEVGFDAAEEGAEDGGLEGVEEEGQGGGAGEVVRRGRPAGGGGSGRWAGRWCRRRGRRARGRGSAGRCRPWRG